MPRLHWQRHPTRLSQWLVRWALAVPMAYHGLWNLSAEGAAWWADDSGLPAELRFAVGLGELAASLSLGSGVLSRLAALALIPLMLGAIFQHAEHYSFKVGGFETPLVYAILAVAIALEPSTFGLARQPMHRLKARPPSPAP